MTKIEPRLLKGFRDYSPDEQGARQAMFATIQSVFERFGFLPLSTPVLEYKEILMGKYGEDEKLIYSFKDNGDRDVAMRYDLTVPLARYVAQNQNTLVLPFKRYQIAPVWRADKPQKGRYREFYQCDVDTIGSDSKLADAEIIACICKTIEALGITKYRLRINDRRVFNAFTDILQGNTEQVKEIVRAIDKADKIGKDGVLALLAETQISPAVIEQVGNWLDIGTGNEALNNISKFVARGLTPIAGQVAEEVKQLIDNIKMLGVAEHNIVFDPSIARGLDYYTSTVYEVMLTDKPEYGSVAAGGRYDNLVDQFSETSLSAVGCSIGVDRLFEAMKDMGLLKLGGAVKVLILNVEETLQNDYVALVTKLRDSGINTEFYYTPVKLEKQFKYAESKNIPYAVIMGRTELDKGMVQLKNLATREQEEVSVDDVAGRLQ